MTSHPQKSMIASLFCLDGSVWCPLVPPRKWDWEMFFVIELRSHPCPVSAPVHRLGAVGLGEIGGHRQASESRVPIRGLPNPDLGEVHTGGCYRKSCARTRGAFAGGSLRGPALSSERAHGARRRRARSEPARGANRPERDEGFTPRRSRSRRPPSARRRRRLSCTRRRPPPRLANSAPRTSTARRTRGRRCA